MARSARILDYTVTDHLEQGISCFIGVTSPLFFPMTLHSSAEHPVSTNVTWITHKVTRPIPLEVYLQNDTGAHAHTQNSGFSGVYSSFK